MTDDKEVTAEITPEDAEFRSRAEEAGIPGIIVSMYGNALRMLVENERKAERDACADKTGEFARKWWSLHCASNKHMETTRKAHDDFCALQSAVRARGQA